MTLIDPARLDPCDLLAAPCRRRAGGGGGVVAALTPGQVNQGLATGRRFDVLDLDGEQGAVGYGAVQEA